MQLSYKNFSKSMSHQTNTGTGHTGGIRYQISKDASCAVFMPVVQGSHRGQLDGLLDVACCCLLLRLTWKQRRSVHCIFLYGLKNYISVPTSYVHF